ncbi:MULTISPECIES: amidase [Pseudonocardia]|uniref:6-aminohexanoate-cyclic-dimer hydrolase n=2 Tax=Pseudonocardia TaxID=1847 RepID=A0A1Y2MRT7_PSEAH|nr:MULTISPECIES: amidase [Pseudonocardia]OSY37932.1 6-aminohexanoate-cyclic-dimer hydrolase [Pseudonocardia autotrophica]TDN74593.1 amidase [Pseudonocardia autotrophica]BBG05363.1 6-aminohexanoate-cyclic-dimer hydrolase [Pseudonocardia autotrophica]GEC29009.1 6-aminohexanoate-cyclic-dimer hydrolase [Pseudonocardia saturnea]
MDTEEIAWLDATAQAALVREGEVSASELVDAAIARVEKLNPHLNAVVYERFDRARSEAADASLPNGPLRGVPYVAKDLLQTFAGEPQSSGWKVLKDLDFRAPITSYVAQKLTDSGLVRLGQTATPEWGATVSAETDAWGVTPNPWDLSRSAGGSSTGSAVAVASGMVPLAHGNDAGGSVRIPAGWCGLVGLKATRGRTSLGPAFGEFANGHTEEGALTRTVRDSALAMDVIGGAMPGDPYPAPPPARPYVEELTVDPGRLRIGYLRETADDLASFSVDAENAVDTALELLTSLGHEVEDSRPSLLETEGVANRYLEMGSAYMASTANTMEQAIGRALTPEDFSPWVWSMLERGRRNTAVDFLDYLDWRNAASRNTAAWWEAGHDVLVVPTTADVAPAIGELGMRPGETFEDVANRYYRYVPITHVWNATGQPAISLPLYVSPAGLPLGVSFVAAQGREDILYRLAAQIERAAPWADRRPPACFGSVS